MPVAEDGNLANANILELQREVNRLGALVDATAGNMVSDPPFVQLRSTTTDLHNVLMVWETLADRGESFVELAESEVDIGLDTVVFLEDATVQIMVQLDVAPSSTFSGTAGFEINGTILGDLGVDFLNYPYVTVYHFRPSAGGLPDFVATTTFPPVRAVAGMTLQVKGVRTILAGSVVNNGSVLGIVRLA